MDWLALRTAFWKDPLILCSPSPPIPFGSPDEIWALFFTVSAERIDELGMVIGMEVQ